jgi:hypothetical protein
VSIIRAPRPESAFYTLDKRISEDARLSWAARGLLIFLLGKPDHWSVSVEHLRKQTEGARIKTGRDGVYALLAELQAAGYIQRRPQRRDSAGHLAEADYMVSETPIDPQPPEPETADPSPVQPSPVQPYTAGTTVVKTDIQQELIPSIAPRAGGALALTSLSPPVVILPSTSNADVAITEDHVAEFEAAYPAVDVRSELLKMRAWLIANPQNRKTPKGMLRFANNWLSRAQDRAPVRGGPAAAGMSRTAGAISDLEAIKRAALRAADESR